jgi:hypothetical protein
MLIPGLLIPLAIALVRLDWARSRPTRGVPVWWR